MFEKCVRCSAIQCLAYESLQGIRERKSPQPFGESSQLRPRFNAQAPHTLNCKLRPRRIVARPGAIPAPRIWSAGHLEDEAQCAGAQDSLRLLRTRRYSSASISVIPSRWASKSSLWRRASLASAGKLSAINTTASSGPPSPTRSSVRGRRSRPAGRRLTLPSGFFKQTHPNWRI